MRHRASVIRAAALCAAAAVAGAVAAAARNWSDAQIEAAVRRSFIYRDKLRHDDIRVASKDGAVVLTGSVSEGPHKVLAYEAAAAQAGVKNVDDRLEIKPPGPPAGSDARLAAKVKTALLFRRSASAAATGVDAKDGVVTLRGRAESPEQKDSTVEAARDVEGVKVVRDAMTVAPKPGRRPGVEEAIDDASVTAEVKLTLLFHRSTGALNARVATSSGVVTLSGKAASSAQRETAGRIAADVRGVMSVQNELTVDASSP